jgi:DNA-binding XRE family transcriptional regulator
MGSISNISPAISENAIAENTDQPIVNRWGNAPPPHNYDLPRESVALGTAKADPSFRVTTSAGSELQNDVSSRFGRRLRQLRRERELTQSNMAKKFGIDRSFISDVERGRKSISLPMLEVIALGLRISLSELFEDI